MRVFRLVLTVALAAAVFAQDAPPAETTTELASVQGNVDEAAPTPDYAPEIAQSTVAAVQPETIDGVKKGAAGVIDATETAVTQSGIANDVPKIDPALAGAAGSIIKQVANTDIAKENDVSASERGRGERGREGREGPQSRAQHVCVYSPTSLSLHPSTPPPDVGHPDQRRGPDQPQYHHRQHQHQLYHPQGGQHRRHHQRHPWPGHAPERRGQVG